MFNQVVLIGRLGGDPELRFTKTSLPVCKFSLATEHRFKSGDEWKSVTDWHKVTIFGKKAEWAERDLRKGDQVTVVGRISYSTVEDRDGNKRYFTDIIADKLGYPKAPGDRSDAGAQDSPARRKPRKDDFDAGFSDDEIPF